MLDPALDPWVVRVPVEPSGYVSLDAAHGAYHDVQTALGRITAFAWDAIGSIEALDDPDRPRAHEDDRAHEREGRPDRSQHEARLTALTPPVLRGARGETRHITLAPHALRALRTPLCAPNDLDGGRDAARTSSRGA